MGKLTRATHLQYGNHLAGNWLTYPGSGTHFLEPEGGYEATVDYAEVPRDFERGDGYEYEHLNGLKTCEISGLVVPIYGLSAGGAVEGVDSASLSAGPAGDMLTSFMGAAPANAVGEATSGSPGTGTTVTADATTAFVAGRAIAVEGATSGLLHGRFVESVSGADVTVCRALAKTDGTSENPAASSDIIAGRVWSMDFANSDHLHQAFDWEGVDFRYRLFGMHGTATINTPSGGYASISASLTGSDWEGPMTKANPVFTAPTQGKHVRVIHSPLYIGSDLYMARIEGIDLGLTNEDRASDGAPNARFGSVTVRKQPTMSFRLSAGSLTAPKELTEAVLDTLRGDQDDIPGTYDVLLQLGRQAGGMMLVRFKEAQLRPRRVREGGQWAATVTARSVGAVSIALF